MNESTKLTTRPASTADDTLGRFERTSALSTNLHAAYGYDHGEEQGSHLKDYWHILRKRLWLIIGMTVIIPTLAAIYLIRKPDVYEAYGRIQVDLENANPLLGGM